MKGGKGYTRLNDSNASAFSSITWSFLIIVGVVAGITGIIVGAIALSNTNHGIIGKVETLLFGSMTGNMIVLNSIVYNTSGTLSRNYNVHLLNGSITMSLNASNFIGKSLKVCSINGTGNITFNFFFQNTYNIIQFQGGHPCCVELNVLSSLLVEVASKTCASFCRQTPFYSCFDKYAPYKVHANPSAENWNYGTMYQIQIPGFYRGGNATSGPGNVQGVIEKLQYLDELGVESIWLTQETLGGAWWGFNMLNQSLINPARGTNQDVEDLCTAAHSRNIKVMLGHVWTHVDVSHPWFQLALGGDREYMSRFVFSVNPSAGLNLISGFPDSWISTRDRFPTSALALESDHWYFSSSFTWPNADLNISNVNVQALHIGSMKYWIDRGIDGFRIDSMDAPLGVRGNLTRQGWDIKLVVFDKMVKEVKAYKPTVLIAGESYNARNVIGNLFGGAVEGYSGFTFLYPLVSANYPGPKLVDLNFLGENISYVDMFFMNSHDTARIVDYLEVTYESAKLTEILSSITSAYSPAVNGTVRLHFDKTTLPVSITESDLDIYYFFFDSITQSFVVSAVFPTSAVNPNDPTDGYYIGGGFDAYGPYWDFPYSAMGGGGFIFIEHTYKVKVSAVDIIIPDTIRNPILVAGVGDIFFKNLPLPTNYPSTLIKDYMKMIYGIHFARQGTPVIYQGDEFGMRGLNSDQSREPLIWSSAGAQVTNFSPYNFSSDGYANSNFVGFASNNQTVLPPDTANDLYLFMKQAILARKESATLKYGTLKPLNLSGTPDREPVTITDENSTNLTIDDIVAFKRVLQIEQRWELLTDTETFVIANKGTTNKTILFQPHLKNICVDDILNYETFYRVNFIANRLAEIKYSHNAVVEPSQNGFCTNTKITLMPRGIVVFTPMRIETGPVGDFFEYYPICSCF